VSILGTRVVRTEDPKLLTVGGTYVEDLRLPELTGAARVTFVRSPMAHAEITGIDVAAALDMPGAVAVFTAQDMDDLSPPPPPSEPGSEGAPLPMGGPYAEPLLAIGRDPGVALLAYSGLPFAPSQPGPVSEYYRWIAEGLRSVGRRGVLLLNMVGTIDPRQHALLQAAGVPHTVMVTIISCLWPIALFIVAWLIYRRISSDQPAEVVAPFALTFAWILVAPWVFAWYTAVAWAALTQVPRNPMTRWLTLVTVFLALCLSSGGGRW